MVHVNILQRVKTPAGWSNVALKRDERGRIKWPSGGRFLIEWRKAGTRLREAAGDTPADALEAQKRKRLEIEAEKRGLTILDESEPQFPLTDTIAKFLADIKTFRKKLTWQKYDHILNLFAEYVAPKSDARQITADDVKQFLAWRKSKGFDPGTTLYTDRVILHNFFNRLKIDNPVKDVPKLPKFRKRPVAYADSDLKRLFTVCDDWEKVLFSLALATGIRRGELQTLEWGDIDVARRRLHVRAKPQYGFLPKDWEERTVPLTREIVALLKRHERTENCPLVFPSRSNAGKLSSPQLPARRVQERGKARQAKRNGVASAPLPRYRCDPLASRRNRRQDGARVARSRIARDHAEIPGTIEKDGKAAQQNAPAVLNCTAN